MRLLIFWKWSNNKYQWPSTRQATIRGTTRVHNIDALTALSTQVTSLTNMVNAMSIAPVTINKVVEASSVYCGEENLLDSYLGNPVSINYMGKYNR